MKLLKVEMAVLAALVICCIVGIWSFAETGDGVRESVLRLHVIANSDSDEDQALKLEVRDAVLKAGKDIFDGSVTKQEAKARLEPRKQELEKAAAELIKERGYNYSVRVNIETEFFPTRTYENITLPAGEYMAVRVIIGEGKGQNWWCIMFPPLCLPAAQTDADISDVLTEKEQRLVEKNPKYEPRFKIIEIYEKIVQNLK